MIQKYLFTSDRLGFRNWKDSDLEEFAQLNSNLEVMRNFPKPLSKEESFQFIQRLKNHYEEHGHNYFATEILATGDFIGFIGLAFQTYESAFTPNVDIGWRLKQEFWGKGYATEGAKRCLQFGFKDLNLKKIISTCTKKNLNSEKVMQKIGMTKIGEFLHPNLVDYPDLELCVVYEIEP